MERFPDSSLHFRVSNSVKYLKANQTCRSTLIVLACYKCSGLRLTVRLWPLCSSRKRCTSITEDGAFLFGDKELPETVKKKTLKTLILEKYWNGHEFKTNSYIYHSLSPESGKESISAVPAACLQRGASGRRTDMGDSKRLMGELI